MTRLTPRAQLGIPNSQPAAAECDICKALVHQRQTAEARGDWSKVADINIELRNHPHKGRQ
ncbi:hypothetical protein [Streptomyces natalensis]|uniref:Uncharacterized protein n=1 Tax=Streptomyces natalensis ATCC 27448 TaxID=1240678 RepID=A0A0D7CNZ9_9ACTN|nr:hypothetical protein [Streptomyces natalensis]KIZ17933.1 hypothetical protein SNA_11120 [Streptomyces natalensis ATCC 27448]